MADTMVDTGHTLMTMDTAQLTLLTVARMAIQAAATSGATGFGMAMAIACGGACVSATDPNFNQKHGETAEAVFLFRACQFANVRFWPIADIPKADMTFCGDMSAFDPKADIYVGLMRVLIQRQSFRKANKF
jgi:hypothetical protein